MGFHSLPVFCLLNFVLFALFPDLSALETETSFGANGPRVCLSTPFVIPKYVNAICSHRNLTYVGGLFNRFGQHSANSFAVITSNDTVAYLGYMGADATLENIARANDVSKFGGIITTMACPEDDDYIYIGGYFRNVSISKFDLANENYEIEEKDELEFDENGNPIGENDQNKEEVEGGPNENEKKGEVELDDLAKIERNHDIIVNNIVLFNTVTKEFEPLRYNRSADFDGTEIDPETNKTERIGFTHASGCSTEGCDPDKEMAIVQTIECASNGGRR